MNHLAWALPSVTFDQWSPPCQVTLARPVSLAFIVTLRLRAPTLIPKQRQLPRWLAKLVRADAEQTYGPARLPVPFEQGQGRTVDHDGIIGRHDQARLAGEGSKIAITQFDGHRAAGQPGPLQVLRHPLAHFP